jgi:hypothetical protein
MNELQLTASGTIPGYSCVKLVGSDQVGVTTSSSDVVFGVTTYSQKASGEVIELQTDENSTRLLRAGGTIAAGDFLVPSSTGTVIKSTDGGGQFIATEAATLGQNVWALLSSTKSSTSQVNYLAPGSSTVREVSSKLAEQVSVKDFGAVGDGVTDDTAAIQAALTSAGNTDSSVLIPATSSFYRITDKLTIPNGVSVVGQGFGSLIKQITLKKNIFEMGHDTVISNLNLEMPTNVAAGYDYANQNADQCLSRRKHQRQHCLWLYLGCRSRNL